MDLGLDTHLGEVLLNPRSLRHPQHGEVVDPPHPGDFRHQAGGARSERGVVARCD